MSIEHWKDIEGFEGLYQVSNLGKVKSLKRKTYSRRRYKEHPERILKDNVDAHGYVYYFLYKDGKAKRYKGHKLVAHAFIPNPNNYPFINHKDENKANNCVSNLEWCTPSYNLNYGSRSQKYMKPVIMIDSKSQKEIKRFKSLKQVEDEMGISHSKVSYVCYGKRKTAGGYSWRCGYDTTF